jgi:hypothetical protein
MDELELGDVVVGFEVEGVAGVRNHARSWLTREKVRGVFLRALGVMR